jgi:flavin reductase (DIM6/NTAB) family NADH-FMN oxidoreductase RutF
MKKRMVKPFRPAYPSPAALVTSVDEAGRPNVLTLGEVFNVSIGVGTQPVILGIAIAKPRYSHQLITATREYVVNFPPSSMVKTVDLCGTVSGRDVDKFAEFGLTPVPATHVRPPLIAECPLNVECRVLSILEVGDHDLFLGEVLAEHVAEEALDDTGRVLVDKLDFFCYLHNEYWSCGRRLGRHGFSRQ